MKDEFLNSLGNSFTSLITRLSGRPMDVKLQNTIKALIATSCQGSICIDLNESSVAEDLIKTGTTGLPGQFKPMILDGNRLYLYRMYWYEKLLAGKLTALAEKEIKVDVQSLNVMLDSLFGKVEPDNAQRAAAHIAATRKLCVITGGPGTGKTTTVARILLLLLMQNPGVKIALAAPTGKAADRMKESVQQVVSKSEISDALKKLVPSEGFTLHRLLGRHGLSYAGERQLPYDVIIVDEASMVDLGLMAKLVSRLKDSARLILVGDKEQLSSVAPGYVLGDICGTKETQTDSDLKKCIVKLSENYRLNSGVKELMLAVQDGDCDKALDILKDPARPDVVLRNAMQANEIKNVLKEKVLKYFVPVFKAHTPQEKLERLGRFKMLCALRDGKTGVDYLNGCCEEILEEKGFISQRGFFYDSMPVMITVNDYSLRLFNGDAGIIMRDAANRFTAFFSSSEGQLKRIPAVQLPEHETTFAMTVHKSQGSEYDEVLLVLPAYDSKILTRELLYTAITRAKGKLEICADEEILRLAITRKTERRSGLSDRLWKK